MLATPELVVRRLEPDEAGAVLDAVFEQLSIDSRRLRFHTPMPRMPAYARRQLAQIDGWSHVAVAAWADDRPIGIGRFVCMPSDDVEVAVEVVDDWQGHGVGSMLLHELTTLARALGYRRLIADVLPENIPMLRLLRQVFPGALVSRTQGVIRVTCSIVSLEPARTASGPLPEQRAASAAALH